MLVREQPATELAIASRILSRAGALAPDGRVTLRLADVMYVAARGVALATMTPYDVAVLLVADGSRLHGEPPDDADAYLDAHRRSPEAGSVARVGPDEFVSASTLRACAVAALRRARGEAGHEDHDAVEQAWLDLVAQARVSGALIGAFPIEEGEAP